jgi:hypothetical protein
MLLALISVVYSALRAGSNTALFRFTADAAEPADQPLLDDDHGRDYVKVRATLHVSVRVVMSVLSACRMCLLGEACAVEKAMPKFHC